MGTSSTPPRPASRHTVDLEPRHGLLVRDPVLGDVLPPGGRVVEQSLYWIRRLRDGDVIEANRSPAPAPAAPTTEAEVAPAAPTAAQVVEKRMENEL